MSENLLRHDNSIERTLSELKELARNQPGIALDDPRVITTTGAPVMHTKFRDNFYTRFPELKAVREGRAEESQVTYVRMVKERFAIDLLRFYDEQPQLCDSICDAIEAKDPYDKLTAGHAALVGLEGTGELAPGTADELHLAVEHPLGLEAIGMYYWDRINPLLEEAYSLFDDITLNAPFLTK